MSTFIHSFIHLFHQRLNFLQKHSIHPDVGMILNRSKLNLTLNEANRCPIRIKGRVYLTSSSVESLWVDRRGSRGSAKFLIAKETAVRHGSQHGRDQKACTRGCNGYSPCLLRRRLEGLHIRAQTLHRHFDHGLLSAEPLWNLGRMELSYLLGDFQGSWSKGFWIQ